MKYAKRLMAVAALALTIGAIAGCEGECCDGLPQPVHGGRQL